MRKISSILLLILLGLNISATEKYTGSLLWKISGNGLEKPSYILGTHHFIDNSILDSIAGYTEAWEATQKVIGEIVLTNKQQVANAMQSYILLNSNSIYEERLSELDKREIERMYLEMFGNYNSHLAFHFKPAFLGVLYTQYLYKELNPTYNPILSVSIDEELQNKALKENKSVEGLESIDDQANLLFNQITIENQTDELKCLLHHRTKATEELMTLNEYYIKAKLWELYDAYVNKPSGYCQTNKKYIKLLLDDRNLKWLQSMPDSMSKAPTLFVVGALHLPGKNGLLYKLNEMGYTVSPAN